MTLSKLISREHISAMMAMENSFRAELGLETFELSTSSDDTGEEAYYMFHDRKLENMGWQNLVKDDDVVNIVSAHRSKSTSKYIYEQITTKYGNAFLKNKAKILKYIQDYLKSQLVNLSVKGPSRRVVWNGDRDAEFVNVCGADVATVRKIVRESPDIVIGRGGNNAIAHNPFYCVIVILICWYYNNSTKEEQKLIKQEKLNNHPLFLLNLMLVVRNYSSIQHKYFKHGVDENLMDRVIDELTNRHRVKDSENMFDLLRFVAFTNLGNTVPIMQYPTDNNYQYFLNNLINRINSYIQKLANAYYDYVNEGKSVGIDQNEEENEEGKKYSTVSTNISNDISEITRKLLIKLTTHSNADMSILHSVCKQTKMNENRIKLALEKMVEKDSIMIGTLMSDIITYYLSTLGQPKNMIKNIKFITLMKRAYSISNTENEIILKIKDTLDTLMKRNSAEYLKVSRLATLSNYRLTVFLYFVLYISKNVS